MNSAKIYLCKADCSILGSIGGIKTDTCSLTRNATDLWEITFEVDRYIELNGQLVQSNFYDSIDDMMRLYLDSENVQAFFVIDSEPTISGEGFQEVKTVTAHSIECELNHIYLKNFKVNCGTYDSQEYLVTDEEGNLVNNINNYNANTMKYISLIDYEDTRYSLMHLALQNTDWKIKDNISKDICELRGCFDISNSIYSFLMKTVSPALKIIFDFDRKNKEIGIVKVEDFGKDTGIFVTMRNIMNSFEVTSSSDDAIMTKLVPTGADNLSIEQVNFGEDYIINLDYFMNTLNEYGDYKYVSKDLHDKYTLWQNYRHRDLVQYTFPDREFEGTRRELYRELTKEYNGIYGKISDLTNRLPNDGCCIDYSTYSLEELNESLIAYNNALVALLTLYKNDIIDEFNLPYDADNLTDPTKSTQITINDDYSLTIIPEPTEPIFPTLLPDTEYWYDYYSYNYTIIPKVEEAIKAFDDVDYEPKSIDSYLYEWELYGLDELESKKKAWEECSNILYKKCFDATDTSDSKYIKPTEDAWNNLNNNQSLFTSKDAFIIQLNQFLDYMSDYERENSLTGTVCKGIIVQCEEAIANRNAEISILKNSYSVYRVDIENLVKSSDIKFFEVDGEIVFTTEDINIINSMLRTKDYSNENILTTNLNDVVTTVDVQEELYQNALIKLNEISQPQYSFKTEMDNLYSLEEFKAYREPFDVGNFIRVGLEIHEDLYDNNYIKLRLMSIAHNPLEISEDLSVEFSTMTNSLGEISDFAFLFDEQNSSSGGSSSSSSSSSGTYGNNDASVQMSNTMLNALLKTEMFGTAVNDVILDTMKANKGNFNTLFSHSGVFDSLEAGQIKVSGDCLFDRIKSKNWNGTESNLLGNTEGSIIDLSDGKFNFAGGKLKWNGTTLSVDGNGKFTGDIVANSLTLGGNATVSGLSSSDLTDANKIILKDLGIGSQNSTHSSNYIKVSSSGLLEADNAIIHGTVYATNGEFAGTLKGCDGSFTGSMNVNNKFIVDANGNVKADGDLIATNANISGDVTATTLTANQSGSIAGWNFNSSAFYKNDINIGSKNGFYIGEDGISIGDYFVTNNEGVYFKNKESYLTYDIDAYFPYVESGQYCRIYLNNINDYIGSEITLDFWGYVTTGVLNHEGSIKKTITLSNGYLEWDNTASKYLIIVNISDDVSYIDILGNYFLYSSHYSTLRDVSTFENVENPPIKYNKANGHLQKITTTEGVNLEVIKIENTSTNAVRYSDIVSRTNYFLIDAKENIISCTHYDLLEDDFRLYENYSIKILDAYNENASTIFRLNKSEIYHNGLTTSSSGDNLVISSGNFYQKSSSSQRYKNSVQSINNTTHSLSTLSPSNLYDIDVVTFKYNDDYLPETDQRYQQDIPGFIAEDVYEKYPIACNLDSEGKPEMWDVNIMFPAALKLIQEQHEDIEYLKEEVNILKETINNSEVS